MAQVDMFLKLDGIEGESGDPAHAGEIQLEGFQQILTIPRDVATGQATGKRRWAHMAIQARVDKSTPLLFQKATENKPIPTATLSCYKAGGKEKIAYLKIELSDVYLAKVQVGQLEVRSGGPAPPQATSTANAVMPPLDVELSFATIVITATPQTSKGGSAGTTMCRDDLRNLNS